MLRRALVFAFFLAAQDLPILPLGKGDVIAVEVEGEADLTKRVTISSKGEIALPMLKDRLQVEGLLPDAIEKTIADAYKHEHLLIDPIVRVTPAEYHSYLVRVTGAVVTPYEFQATEPITLAIALSKAGGPAPNSNGQVQIIRRDRDTGKETTQLVDIRTLLDEADPKDNVTLKGGEEIHLPARL
jgi:protein involved in polysaccharide export with SLBB domain